MTSLTYEKNIYLDFTANFRVGVPHFSKSFFLFPPGQKLKTTGFASVSQQVKCSRKTNAEEAGRKKRVRESERPGFSSIGKVGLVERCHIQHKGLGVQYYKIKFKLKLISWAIDCKAAEIQ